MDKREHMDKREQEILAALEQQSKQIKPPDSLAPEHLGARLRERSGRPRQMKTRLALLAASLGLILIIGGAYLLGRRPGGSQQVSDRQPTATASIHGKDIKAAAGYNEIYKYINDSRRLQVAESSDSLTGSGSSAKSTTESATADPAAPAADSSAAAGSHSETNIRQAGVAEGDIVKTDGQYLYLVTGDRSTIAIVRAGDGRMKQAAQIVIGPSDYVRLEELYVNDGQLIGIYSEDNTAKVVFYDISDPAKPVKTDRTSQSGTYQSSRLVDGYLYLFTNYQVSGQISRRRPETFVPEIAGKALDPADICLPAVSPCQQYTVLAAFSTDRPEEAVTAKAILSDHGEYYVSNENIYFYETVYEARATEEQTVVKRFAYHDGQIEAAAQGTFPGRLNDSFSLDEYQGHLRVVTTRTQTNALYVLDEQLEIIGRIEGLAPGERIYSARLMGAAGYFVTFKETDPLFSVDLSDPEAPRLLGALKIPGFSEYLHPYGTGKLLGIGMEVDEKSGLTGGVKLSLFDISRPEDVSESHKLVLDEVYYADVLDDYKALLIDTEKNLFGFGGQGAGGTTYQVYGYEPERGFVLKLRVTANDLGDLPLRGVYIGDHLYITGGAVIKSYSLQNFRAAGELELQP